MQQKTIKNPIAIEGVGLHSGKKVQMCLRPAEENSGIQFHRTDLQLPPIKVAPQLVREAVMCTKLVCGEQTFMTIEHLLSAMAGLEIDNILVELDSPEIPIVDGSASPFVFLLESAGIFKQEAIRRFIRVKKAVRVNHEDKFAELSPAETGMHYLISLDYTHPVIAKTALECEFTLEPMAYKKNIARARTYGFVKDLDMLHQKQLALGAGLQNAIGLTETAILNPEGLRYADEFVRHKLLDAIGDLYLAGPICGHFRAHKPGHALNNQLLCALLADETAWEWDT